MVSTWRVSVLRTVLFRAQAIISNLSLQESPLEILSLLNTGEELDITTHRSQHTNITVGNLLQCCSVAVAQLFRTYCPIVSHYQSLIVSDL